jgi:hypothetical protein
VRLTTEPEIIAAILAADRDSHMELYLRLHADRMQQRRRADLAEAEIVTLREQLRLMQQALDKALRQAD